MAEPIHPPPTRVEIRADSVVVERPISPPSASHISCVLNLFFNSASNHAFLKFCLSVPVDGQEDCEFMYLFVWPEQITSVTQKDDEASGAQDPDISRLCKSGGRTFCLHIELSSVGSVVGPQTGLLSSMAARLDPHGLHDIKWLGQQTQLTIHISRRAISVAQLEAFCTAASTPGLLKASATHASISQMYGGKGGRIFETFSLNDGDDHIIDENDVSTQSGSPPPYDEAAAGPACPRLGPEEHHAQKSPAKRRRRSSSPESGSGLVLTNISDPLRFFQDICNKVWDNRRAEILAELSRMETRIMHAVKDQLDQQQNELAEQIELAEGSAVAAAEDSIEEALDDKMSSLRLDMEDFVRDEMRDVEESILDQLEAGTWEASFMRRQERHL